MRRAASIVLALVVGCAAPRASDDANREVRDERAPLVTASPGHDGGALDPTIGSPAPGPPPMDPARCVSCHASQAAAWRDSLHAISDTDPIYVAEHAASARDGARDPWCATCHAPEGAPIGCVTCHVRDGEVRAVSASGRAPHATRVDAEMSDERACAGCHDFDFPRESGLAMQDTVDEWRHSAPAERGQTCTSCHDPHGAPGRRDASMVERALDVRARVVRSGEGARLVLTLRSRAGHAVPTGDLFRRLVVRARSGGTEREVILSRRFGRRDGRRVELADDRVPARGARTVVLRLPRVGARVEWTIELEALAGARARSLGFAERDWLTRVARGSVAL